MPSTGSLGGCLGTGPPHEPNGLDACCGAACPDVAASMSGCRALWLRHGTQALARAKADPKWIATALESGGPGAPILG